MTETETSTKEKSLPDEKRATPGKTTTHHWRKRGKQQKTEKIYFNLN